MLYHFSVNEEFGVTFTFTFGDGTPAVEVPGIANSYSRSVATVAHAFTVGE